LALVERLKRWRGLSRLRRQARRAPSPATFGELAERLIALGDTDEALRAAEEGLDRFPDSERLAHVRLFARKGRLTGEIRRLRTVLARRPNPATYSQLARIYRELGSDDDALSIATECAERFPHDEASALVQGQIRIERFRRDMIPKDGVIAETALRKVLRLDGNNVKAHLLLGEICWLVGMQEECRRHLRQVLAITPAEHDVQEFLRAMDGTSDAGPAQESFEQFAEKVEDDGAFANDPARFPGVPTPDAGGRARPAARIDGERVGAEMTALGEHEGVGNAVLLGRDGLVIADLAREGGLSRPRFAELVAGIRAVADDASRRMDMGVLVRAEIESPGGSITVTRVSGLTLALMYADPLRSERAWELLEDFVAVNLASSREAAHA
jgi:Flp pilus assembly protein TadD/predicted regulator of Ras-like GTPase activity (Roadblock/LC7/MglB family)